MIILLTGERGVGKSALCERLACAAHGSGHTVGGVVALPQYDACGDKVGIDLLDVASGERRHQASTMRDLGGPRVGRFSMSAETLTWAAQAVLRAIRDGSDLVLVDEIGPLELEQGGGLAAALPALLKCPQVHAVLVVRSELVEKVRSRLLSLDVSQHEVTRGNRDALAATLAERLWGASRCVRRAQG